MYTRQVNGTLRVTTRVQIVDIFGHAVERTVRVGTAHCVEPEQAVKMVDSARQANPSLNVRATLSVEL